YRLEARLALLDNLGDAGDGAAGADAADQDVHLALRVVPDLLGGGLAVDLRVGRVLELLRHERLGRPAAVLLYQLLGLGDRPAHALFAGSEVDFGAERLEQPAALDRHRLG